MRHSPSSLGLVIAFIAGCAAAPLVIPPLSAQQAAAGVQRWEYHCVSRTMNSDRKCEEASAEFSRLGAEGWEMSGVIGFTGACFKRPL